MDHHGLVAVIGKMLKIENKIDSRLPMQNRKDSLTRGQSVMAMVINGLGFIERRLYMVQSFYKNKPVEKLLGKGVTYEKINDDNLGRTLDAIHEYGESKLFSEIAFEIGLEHKALTRFAHLDTTSISVEGEYDSAGAEIEKGGNFKITHGYSKNHRPDLKQLVLSLTTTGPASFPVWLEALSGNSSDKENFIHTIEASKKFQEQLRMQQSFAWVADAALYTKDKLLSKGNTIIWVTHVPETIKEAKEIVQKDQKEYEWVNLNNGYSITPIESNYGGVKQRWILVFSEKAFENECNTVKLMFERKEEALKSAIKKFAKEIFHCEKDATKSFKNFAKKHSLFILESTVDTVYTRPDGKKGRPKDEEKVLKGYSVDIKYQINNVEIAKHENARGRFILATNDLNKEELPDEMILSEYKNQSKVEGCFKFLKDPSFFASEVYLKKPERVQALMFIMGICLMIYNVGQYHIRKILADTKESVPNQVGKATERPTLKWIFQCFRDIGIVKIFDSAGNIIKEYFANITELHKKIISFFGKMSVEMYGFKNKEIKLPLLLDDQLLLA